MHIKIWGCRGSIASPGATKLRYGGDTSCVEVRLDDGASLILDAGTGIRELGSAIDASVREIHLLLTHLHMDHVEGLPFFGPLWEPGIEVHVWGPASPMQSLKQRIARYMSPPLFPVDVHDVPSACVFHDVPADAWTIRSATILAVPVEHPGPTVGYRVEENGASFAYMPDHEPAVLSDFRSESSDWIDGFAIADRVDLLMHDAQYTREEYEARRGWGHSSVDDAVAYARVTGARQLLLFHHDPGHTDDVLEDMERAAVGLWDAANPPKLAAAGAEIELRAAAVSRARGG